MENGNGNYHDDEVDETNFQERIETLQKVLQTYYNDYSLRLNYIKCSPGSRSGDNYMSIIKRIFVKGTFKNFAGKLVFNSNFIIRDRPKII
jgi:hypothetical protein